MLFLFMAFFEFAVTGSIQIGLPALARQQYGIERGPEINGWMVSSFGAGILLGMLLSGALDSAKLRGKLTTALTLLMGVGFLLLAVSVQVATVCPLLFVIGAGGGTVSILLQAWIQMNTEKRMMGRVMSLLMLGVLIMELISIALAGVLSEFKLPLVFIVSGVMMLTSSLIAFTSRTIHTDS
jgi:MFS family permease